MHATIKPLILPCRPFDKPPVEDPKNSHKHHQPELPIVINPAAYLRIKESCNMVNTKVCSSMEFCFADYFRNLKFTLSANGAIKTQKDLSFLVLGRSRLETKAQKIVYIDQPYEPTFPKAGQTGP
jgi:hypothetical protein